MKVSLKNSTSTLSPAEWFENWDHLGGAYPYYQVSQPDAFSVEIGSLLEQIPVGDRYLDPVGIVEVLNKSYLLDNRTLVRGIKRSPWMGRPNGEGGWRYASVPPHGSETGALSDIVAGFKAALRQEALGYVEGKSRVGILLSGGMDSRMAAGTLRELQLAGDFSGDVVAFTWGIDTCRDVLYAAEIAKRNGWDWLHFPTGPETLKRNIEVGGKMGAEIAPFHLHAMPDIRAVAGVNAIIAGSYGDSVGRAELTGRHVLKLRPMVSSTLNRRGLLRDEVVRDVYDRVHNDAYAYRHYVLRDAEYKYREIEHHKHYTRRMLLGAMGCIGARIPLFQLFTAPETFGYIWSLDIALRDNRIYQGLLKTLPGNLDDIPWARTGRRFGTESGPVDEAPKQHHRYGPWLRNDLQDHILSLVNSDEIRGLGLFNDRALDHLLKLWPKATTLTLNGLDESVSWLASLAVFVKHYQVRSQPYPRAQVRDTWAALKGVSYAWLYQTAREQRRE